GIIGYRALRRAEVPPGGTLGIWGFGGSAHLAAPIAMGQGAAVHVVTRAPAGPGPALSLRGSSPHDSLAPPPVPLHPALLSSPGRAPSSPPHWPPSPAAARAPSPGSTSPTSRR